MASVSKIEWTEATWNPVTGCSKCSPGCAHCYAERLSARLKAMGNPSYANGFKVTLHPHLLSLPSSWRTPRRIFVNSMSDLFHEEVPVHFIRSVFREMADTPRHTYQVLTKRARRLVEIAPLLPWPRNVWMGVSVEDGGTVERLDYLRKVPAAVRFVSCEPLIGPLGTLNLDRIDWVIVGGESGPGARPMRPEWAREIRMACERRQVPFFFKQWGGPKRCRNGNVLDGRIWQEYPSAMNTSNFVYPSP